MKEQEVTITFNPNTLLYTVRLGTKSVWYCSATGSSLQEAMEQFEIALCDWLNRADYLIGKD